MTTAEQPRTHSAETSFARVPAHDLGAEQCVLGAMMLASDAIVEVEGILTAAAFYKPAHELIFSTITAMAGRGEPVDMFTVASCMSAEQLRQIGGAPYLHDLISSVPTAANGAYYARIVADRAVLRGLEKAALRIQQLAHSSIGVRPAGEVLEVAQQLLADIESGAPVGGGPRRWGDILPGVIQSIEAAEAMGDQTPGIPTGLHDLDHLLNGLHPGQLVVVAARTGVGKSVAVMGFAQNAAWYHKLPVLVFSLEMGEVELGKRLVSSDSRVPLHALNTGKLNDQDWTNVTRSAAAHAEAPMFIDDSPNLTIGDIRTRARKMHREHGLRLIVVDYLQLIEAARGENRQIAVAALSRGLKLLAKELQVPVIAVSQLNRGPEQRTNKRPTMADLRESGAIENDADVIILLYREDYYDAESPRAGEADFIVDKNRNGPTDTITVASQLHFSRFTSMAIV